MVIIENYGLAVVMCIITMICWGSWANTQKLASREWKFQLFYWDYSIGVLLLTLILALTMGSMGSGGRGFFADLGQASAKYLGFALLGGVIFNIANILLVAAIDIAGLAVAFPVGIGLALVIGAITIYRVDPTGKASILGLGVAAVAIAIILDALAYKKLQTGGQKAAQRVSSCRSHAVSLWAFSSDGSPPLCLPISATWLYQPKPESSLPIPPLSSSPWAC